MKNNCCIEENPSNPSSKGNRDWLFIISIITVSTSYIAYLFSPITEIPHLAEFIKSNYELMNKMWWGLILGIFFVGIMDLIPRSVVMKILGHKKGIGGILRATMAGVLLDLCSHGVLLVGMKLYERGARISQVMAFLVSSPWNSLSLTVILWALIGWEWTLAFIGLSMVIAIITGMIFEWFVAKKILPENPNIIKHENISIKKSFKEEFKDKIINANFIWKLLIKTLKESRMILRWIFFGVVLASLVRTFIPPETFSTYFGATLTGLGMTLIVATILEVCSEGSVPIAADILTRAGAAGNAFTFLMTGVATDYTEIIVLKETTKSWKIALFLPLVTVPQVLLLGYLLNSFAIPSAPLS